MAVLYITEFANLTQDGAGAYTQVPQAPALASQTVAIGGGSTASSAFNAGTRFIELTTDAICSVAFGTAPTATTSLMRMPANTTKYIGVPVNAAYKVAVISNT